MQLPRHQYRNHSERITEARLTHEMQPASAEIQDVSSKLRNTETDLDALQNAINAHRSTPEAAPLVPSVAQELNRQRDPEIKKKLRALAERASQENKGALKKTIDDIDAEVVAPSTTNADTLLAEQKQEVPTTFTDKAKEVVKNIGKGLGDAGEQMTNAVLPESITKEMSRNKKIAIAGVATVGVGIVLWSLFKRARRAAGEGADAAQQTEGGFFRKWLVRIGVTAGVLFGVKMLADRYLPSDAVKDAAKGAATLGSSAVEGGQKAVSKIKENFNESFNYKNRSDFQTDVEYHQYLASIVEDHGDVVMDRKNFASDEEYTKAMEGMLDEYHKNGGNWVLAGNTLMFIGRNGWSFTTNTWDLTKTMFGKMKSILSEEQTLDKWKEPAVLYGEGIVLYASSFALLDAAYLTFVLGPKGAAIQSFKNTAIWPYTIYKKTERVAGILLNGEGRALSKIERSAAKSAGRYYFNRIKEWKTGLKMTPEYADDLFDEFRLWHNFDTELGNYNISKSILGHRQNMLRKKLQTVCTDLICKQGIVPSFLQNPDAASLVEQMKRGEISVENFQETMTKLYKNYGNPSVSSAASATNAADEVVEAGTDASKAVKATTPEATSQTHHTGQNPASKIDDVDNLKSVEKVADTLSDADLDTFLKTNNIPDALRAEVLADPKAKNIIKGALATGDAAEEARVIQMIQKGSKMRTAVVGGGLALSTLGLYMAYVELSENKEKMLNTKNQELQKLYAESNIIIGVDMGVQVTGILVDGVALYQAASGTVLCSAAAPAGVILLPITVAVMVGREGWRQSAQLREYFAKTDEDLEKDAPSTIFAHIEESKPLTSINTMQSFIETLSVQDAKDQQKANLNARQNGYRAYFAQSAIHLIPHPTEADFRASRSMNNASVSDHDVEMLYKDWISQYVLEAESCIRERTKNQFYLIDADNLSQVRIEAFARWRTKRWGVEGQTPLTPRSTEAMWEEDIATMAVEPDLFIQEFPNYLLTKTRVADALAFAERYLSADTLLSAAKKQIARANLFYDVRQAIRDVTAHVDTQKSISGSAIQHLISDIVRMTEGYALKTKEKTPMTTMMKELIDQPFILNAQTFTHLFTKYPLRPTY